MTTDIDQLTETLEGFLARGFETVPGWHEAHAALGTLVSRLKDAETERDLAYQARDNWRAASDDKLAQLERQEAACAHCAYCVMTQDASSVAPVVADGSATKERLEPEVSPRRSGPSNLARDAAGATPPNQEDE